MNVRTTPQYHVEVLRPLATPGSEFPPGERVLLSVIDDHTGQVATIELHDSESYDLAVALTIAPLRMKQLEKDLGGANTVVLDAMIMPDTLLHSDETALAQLAHARRAVLAKIASGQIRFVVAGGVKFKLEPWGDA